MVRKIIETNSLWSGTKHTNGTLENLCLRKIFTWWNILILQCVCLMSQISVLFSHRQQAFFFFFGVLAQMIKINLQSLMFIQTKQKNLWSFNYHQWQVIPLELYSGDQSYSRTDTDLTGLGHAIVSPFLIFPFTNLG